MSDESTQVDFTFEIGPREVAFNLDEELYPRDAIYGTTYIFIDRCFVFLDRPADRKVRVRLRTREESTEQQLEELGGEFANEMLNQVLRLRIGESTQKIREYYMARAFFSEQPNYTVDELLAELDKEEMEEDPLEISVPWENAPKKAGDGA